LPALAVSRHNPRREGDHRTDDRIVRARTPLKPPNAESSARRNDAAYGVARAQQYRPDPGAKLVAPPMHTPI